MRYDLIKRFIAILSVISALIFAFSACDGQLEAPQETERPTADPNEIMEVSVGMWELYEPQSEAAKIISDYIKSYFNIIIKPVAMSRDNYREELDWMMGANMLPDVFANDIMTNKFQYRVLIDSGSIQSVPKNMWAKLDRLSAVMSWYEDIYSYKGEMYFIPRTYQTFDQTNGATNVIFYRSDWAKDLSYSSFKEEADFTDIIDLLGAYRTSDTDKNTIWDTWGITGSGGIDFIWDAFLTPFGVREWMYEDGKWMPGIISDRAKEAVTWAAQLYREGIIDPDIVTQTNEDALCKFLTGRTGAVMAPAYYSDLLYFQEQWSVHNPDKPITESVKIIPSYITPDKMTYNEVSTFKTGSMISAQVSERKMQKILTLFDFLYSGDGRNLLEYGTLQPEGTGGFLKDAPEFESFANLASWNMDKNPADVEQDSNFVTYAQDVIETGVWPWSFESELFTNGMLTPEMCVLDMNRIAEEKILGLIKTTRDFDADWNLYVDSMYNELNLEDAIAEVNEWAQDYFDGQGD